MRRNRYNELKLKTLAVFSRFDQAWLSAPLWAKLVRYPDRDGASTYLRRLARWGLLHHRRDWRGMVLFRISDKGRRRLRWLRGKQGS
jgi:hypothetical protein